MPRALHSAANQRAVSEGSTAMRAGIVEREIAVRRPRQHDAPAIHFHEFHLVHFELARDHGGLATRGGDPLFLPLAGIGIAVVDTDLVASDERAAHPSGYAH